MPESSDAILETQASSSLHITTPARNLLPRLSLGFSLERKFERRLRRWSALSPESVSSGASSGYLDHHLHPSLRRCRERGA